MLKAIDDIQQSSRRLARLSTLIFVILIVGLCVEAATIPRADNPIAAIKFGLMYRFPFIIYLFAIWKMRITFNALANGEVFGNALPALIKWIGVALSAGAIITIFVSPVMLRLSFGPGEGGYANFDANAIMLGIVGMMLILIARLFHHASEMRVELDEFF